MRRLLFKKNRNFKKVVVSSVALALFGSLLLSSQVAKASDYTHGRSYDWSPYFKNTYANVTDSRYVSTGITFYFDSAGADENNKSAYYTSEINNQPDGLTFVSQSTNISDPHFDTDDDPDTGIQGYAEEAEVSIDADWAKDQLGAFTDYYHYASWKNTRSYAHPGGDIHFLAQRSMVNPVNGEYEAITYDFLEDESFGSLAGSSGLLPTSEDVSKSNKSKKTSTNFRFHPMI